MKNRVFELAIHSVVRYSYIQLIWMCCCSFQEYLVPFILKNPSILAKLSDTGGLHVTSLLKLPAVVKLMSLSMRRHGRIESDDFVTEMVDNNPILTYVYTSRSFQLGNEAFSDKQFKFIDLSLDGRAAQAKDARLDDELNRGGERPVIYASLGTIFNTFMPFYQAVVAAFEDRDVIVELSVGRNFDQMKLGRVPQNIFIHQSVDQLAVLEQADLFITHGGMNSVNEALYYFTTRYPWWSFPWPTISRR